tara:strand:+ start:1072 stop:2103 length:1032 start_codon:yes stop_codon:yes gene_type:complete
MAYIGPEPKLGQNREVDDISSGFNGNTATFNLQVDGLAVSPGSANAILVSLGGIIQNPGTDYTVSTSTITFTTNPASGLSFFGLVLGQGIDTATVADGSVTNAKVSNSAAIAVSKLANFVTNNADNRVITGSGTTNTINGEANLTFDGDTAAITRSGNSAGGLSITNTNNSQASAHARLELSGGDNASAIMRMECNGHANEFIADGSGNLRIDDNGVERMRIDSSGNLKINSGFGSASIVYGVRAWIKFDGEGTVAINGSGNISALTDNGTGDYTVTFSTAMPDTNYAAVGMASSNGGNGAIAINTSSHTPLLYSTTQCRFCNSNTNNGSLLDGGAIGAAFIR